MSQMDSDRELVNAAIAQLKRRWDADDPEAGAAAIRTSDGQIFTSVAFDNINAGVTLCHETGAITQAYTLDLTVMASVCVCRNISDGRYVILAPCGICRERLARWGPAVKVAVPATRDATHWNWPALSDVHLSYWGRQFPDESGWPAEDGPS